VGNYDQNEGQLQQHRLAKVMQILENAVDRKIFELQMSGERKTEAFAKVMAISHLPMEEKRRKVKQAKDRIVAQLKRQKEPQA